MLKILLVLLPLAASAACSSRDVSGCTKCAVGAIGMQFDYSTPCNCNGNDGTYGDVCPATGVPALPKCCSVDGKAATLQDCTCGSVDGKPVQCRKDQMCTAATNTCAYPVCAKIDGSAASTSEKECQCGDTSCSKGQKCTASSSTCANPPPPTCGSGASTTPECKCGTTKCSMTQTCTASTSKCESPPQPTCGSGVSKVQYCKCGTEICYSGDTCTASTSTCKKPDVPACKKDIAVTAKCMCQKGASGSSANQASVGQICPKDSNDPVWPACKGGDVFATLNQKCKCADKDDCGYGQKCTQAGDFKGFCECVASDDVVCVEKVPPTEKCPKTCDGHTTMDATAYVLGQCSSAGSGYWQMYTAANNVFSSGYYTDSACTTKVPAYMTAGQTTEWSAGCQSSKSTFYSLPSKASGSTALQVAMPVALVAGLLGSILL